MAVIRESKALSIDEYVSSLTLNPKNTITQSVKARSKTLSNCMWDIRSIGEDALLYPLAFIEWKLKIKKKGTVIPNSKFAVNNYAEGDTQINDELGHDDTENQDKFCIKDGFSMANCMDNMTLTINGSSTSFSMKEIANKWLLLNAGKNGLDYLGSTTGGKWDTFEDESYVNETLAGSYLQHEDIGGIIRVSRTAAAGAVPAGSEPLTVIARNSTSSWEKVAPAGLNASGALGQVNTIDVPINAARYVNETTVPVTNDLIRIAGSTANNSIGVIRNLSAAYAHGNSRFAWTTVAAAGDVAQATAELYIQRVESGGKGAHVRETFDGVGHVLDAGNGGLGVKGAANYLFVGQYVAINNRAYRVEKIGEITDVDSGKVTSGNVTFYPPLGDDVPQGTPIRYIKPSGLRKGGIDKVFEKRCWRTTSYKPYGIRQTTWRTDNNNHDKQVEAEIKILEPVLIPPFNPFVEFEPSQLPDWSPYRTMSKAIPHMNRATLTCNFSDLGQSLFSCDKVFNPQSIPGTGSSAAERVAATQLLMAAVRAGTANAGQITVVNNGTKIRNRARYEVVEIVDADLKLRWYAAPPSNNYAIPKEVNLQTWEASTYLKTGSDVIEVGATKNKVESDYIRLETTPSLLIFTVEPQPVTGMDAGTQVDYNNRNLYAKIEDIQITINTDAGALQQSLSSEELYHLSCENFSNIQNIPYPYQESAKRFIVALRPYQLGQIFGDGVQTPVNLTYKLNYSNSLYSSAVFDTKLVCIYDKAFLQLSRDSAMFAKQQINQDVAKSLLLGIGSAPPQASGAGVSRRIRPGY